MGQVHEFILERVHEDAMVALTFLYRRSTQSPRASSPSQGGPSWGPLRVLDECEIKREVVSIHADGACPECLSHPGHGCKTVRLLAEAWQEHPKYRTDWSGFRDGDPQMRPSRAAAILEEMAYVDCPPGMELATREAEVLQLIADGVDYANIARQLFVSVNTVANHVRNAVKKSQLFRPWEDGPGPAGWPA